MTQLTTIGLDIGIRWEYGDSYSISGTTTRAMRGMAGRITGCAN